jgi:hypothetical protein
MEGTYGTMHNLLRCPLYCSIQPDGQEDNVMSK